MYVLGRVLMLGVSAQARPSSTYNNGWGQGPVWGGNGMTTWQAATIHVGAVDLEMYDAAKK
jgi:hypothetical protein